MAWGRGFLSLACAPVAGQDRAAFRALLCRLTERRPETLDILGETLPTPRATGRGMSPDHAVTHTLRLDHRGAPHPLRPLACAPPEPGAHFPLDIVNRHDRLVAGGRSFVLC